jgi:sulfoxide reductase heme-binding subunit YedZ
MAKTTRQTQKWLLAAVHLGSLLPLVLFGLDAALGRLGFNPIETALHRSGRTAVAILLLSLTVTPIIKIFNLPMAIRLRKPLGLYAALYAGLHFAAFVVWDFGLNFGLIWLEFTQKPFLWVGLGALVILAVLAATSTRFWKKKLRSGWRRLHRTVYLAAGLALVHYLLAVKGDLLTLQGEYTRPLLAAGALLLLMVLRVPAVQQIFQRNRRWSRE